MSLFMNYQSLINRLADDRGITQEHALGEIGYVYESMLLELGEDPMDPPSRTYLGVYTPEEILYLFKCMLNQ